MPACHDHYEPDDVAVERRPVVGRPEPPSGECHDVYPQAVWAPADDGEKDAAAPGR